MGRIIKKIKIFPELKSVNESNVLAVFDTGSERSYVKKELLPKGVNYMKIKKFSVKMGGNTHGIDERCTLVGEIDGLPFDFSAHVIDTIGEVDKRDVDLIIGATAMEEWDMVIHPKGQEIDLQGLKKREFLEL